MVTKHLIFINFRGGIISPGYLKELLLLAKEAKVYQVCFSLRQQLILSISSQTLPAFTKGCKLVNIDFYSKKLTPPNIVSSYFADGIFGHESWLREGVYKDIFDLFDYEPQLKINVCDKDQRGVLLFNGNLNWISAPSKHFWYLYIRFPHSRVIYSWPELVYTNEIAALSKSLEEELLNINFKNKIWKPADGATLFQKMQKFNKVSGSGNPIKEPMKVSTFALPYYEGFNQGSNGYWLGIYRRDEQFPIDFLIDSCDICMETKIGEIYISNWKSIIIKGIDRKNRQLWDYILGKYRINVRHAANELNWQIEEGYEALGLKRIIIRHFDKEDVRTFGLCFAIQSSPLRQMFASIVIRKSGQPNVNKLKHLERYDILYAPQFDPNEESLILFRENVEKGFIAAYLVSLCKIFYEQENNPEKVPKTSGISEEPIETFDTKYLYQCQNCLSIYHPSLGDPQAGIDAGTVFESLPESYCCPVCESPLGDYAKIEEKQLEFAQSLIFND